MPVRRGRQCENCFVSRRRLAVLFLCVVVVASVVGYAVSRAASGTNPAKGVAALALSDGRLTAIAMTGIAFGSPEIGAALVVESYLKPGATTGTCAVGVRTTTDGGASFGPRGGLITQTSCADGLGVNALAMDANGTLFAYGPDLFESADHGATWRSIAHAGAIVAVDAVGPSVWAISSSCSGRTGFCHLTLLTSANAGGSWRIAAVQPPQRTTGPTVDYLSPMILVRVNAKTAYLEVSAPASGWKLSANGTYLPSSHAGGAYVEQTPDGGTTWTVDTAPCIGTGVLARGPDSSLWLLCGGEPATGMQPKSLAISRDNGRTWNLIGRVCALGSLCTETIPIIDSAFGLAAVSPDHALIVQGSDAWPVIETTDGGQRWRSVRRAGAMGDAGLQVLFVNSNVGWILDHESGLFQTTDGGKSWKKLVSSMEVITGN